MMSRLMMGALAAVLVPCAAWAAPINQVAPGSITGTALITFDDVAGGGAPGTNYNGIFESGNANFAERFVGQTNTPAGNFDVLSGTPSGPLALALGPANQNLNIFINASSQVLTGLGPLGFPSFDAIGEGAFAVLFDFDQSQFAFDLVGGNGGSAVVNFFRRDGSLIDSITLNGLGDQSYGFIREGDVHDIAGISIHNNDLAGIGFDNLRHDVEGVPGDPDSPPTGVPGPPSVVLLGIALAALGAISRRSSR